LTAEEGGWLSLELGPSSVAVVFARWPVVTELLTHFLRRRSIFSRTDRDDLISDFLGKFLDRFSRADRK